jgi:hypothetical protein
MRSAEHGSFDLRERPLASLSLLSATGGREQVSIDRRVGLSGLALVVGSARKGNRLVTSISHGEAS